MVLKSIATYSLFVLRNALLTRASQESISNSVSLLHKHWPSVEKIFLNMRSKVFKK